VTAQTPTSTASGPGPGAAHAPGATPTASLPADPEHLAAITDLLGLMACAELLAFERLAHDATLAPNIAEKAEVAAMAVAEFNHYTLLCARLRELNVDPEAAMAPFADDLSAFHRRIAAGNWLEGLVKAFVGDGLAADFYREIAVHLDPGTRDLVLRVLADTGHSEFAVDRIRAGIAADRRVAGPLALWGRRLVGEVMTQAQRIAAEREGLTTLIVGGVDRPGLDLAEIAAMLDRLTKGHTDRMAALGLDA
jgi:hypothetical protein